MRRRAGIVSCESHQAVEIPTASHTSVLTESQAARVDEPGDQIRQRSEACGALKTIQLSQPATAASVTISHTSQPKVTVCGRKTVAAMMRRGVRRAVPPAGAR
jgi:hypothetical protein